MLLPYDAVTVPLNGRWYLPQTENHPKKIQFVLAPKINAVM
jgi:hypothetical protein